MNEPTISGPASTVRREPRLPRLWLLRRLVPYAVLFAVTMVAMTVVFELWHFNFRQPLQYNGDGLQHLVYTKAFVENGWYLHNPSLGAPGEMDLREFPAADTLPGVLTLALGLFTHNPALLVNLLYLLTYPLASLTAFFTCRRMGISTGPAILAGVLYAFLPYHLWRGTAHLYLSCYFVAPLGVLVAWWVATGRLLDRAAGGGGRRLALAAVICAGVSTAGVYYPFFAGVFLAVGSLAALCRRRDWRHFLAGGALAALLTVGTLLCLLPTLLFVRSHPHPPISQRGVGESELYGLKLIQLILPPNTHRLDSFRTLTKTYLQGAPLVTENTSAALGSLGAVGCVGLLGWLLFRPFTRAPEEAPLSVTSAHLRDTLDMLGMFNGAAVLYGTIGGFGALFALLVAPQVRGLNRISVFIGFLSLAAVAACVDRWWIRPEQTRLGRLAGWAGMGLLLAAGLYDQTSPLDTAHLERTAADYRMDRAFFHEVQALVPAGTMIFQLPYVPFPEAPPPTETMGGDTHFRGYIQTEGLRWSYGAVKGGRTDYWQRQVASLPLPEGVRTLALGGFGGILLELEGYPAHGVAVEAELRRLLGPPTAGRSARLFFNMEGYNRTLRASMTDEQWRTASEKIRDMVTVRFGDGFSGPETGNGHSWYWCGPEGRIMVSNGGEATRSVRLSLSAHAGRPVSAHLTLTSDIGNQAWIIDATTRSFTVVLAVTPGDHKISFACDGLPGDAPADPRVLVWRMDDFRLEDAEPVPTSATADTAGQSH